MSAAELARDVLQTALRMAPWPTDTGLRRSGEPGPHSPVIVTCNYDLTVRRVLRALRGVDAWVVVAPSSGINVWCAAAGGHFATHHVVTALKTSGVADRVVHRRAILPQLAATGVIAREVSRRCGWRVRFGPVEAADLPRYLDDDGRKTDDMRRVRFGVSERLQMAAAWGAPTALVVGGAAAWLRPAWSLPLAGLAAGLSVALFLTYDRIPGRRRTMFGAAAVLVSLLCVALAGGSASALLAAALAGAGLTAILTYDYTGSTPIEGGSLFEERRWHVELDRERCQGVYNCWQVCPEACFEKLPDERKIVLAHDDRCVRCGACIVQCPLDALAFQDQDGARIPPDTIRRTKLNLMGRRAVEVADGAADR